MVFSLSTSLHVKGDMPHGATKVDLHTWMDRYPTGCPHQHHVHPHRPIEKSVITPILLVVSLCLHIQPLTDAAGHFE